MKEKYYYDRKQMFSLVVLRVLTGWYFLYEGLAKVFTPNWTSYGYLMDSKGCFAPLFKMVADSPTLIMIADKVMIYGLIMIGLSLILGCLTRYGSLGAMFMMVLFYLSHPPLIDVTYILRPEGSYLWVDKNLIMLSVIAVLMTFPTSHIIGFDRVLLKRCRK